MGLYLSTEPSSSVSSCHFSASFLQAQEAYIIQDAVFIHTEAEIQPPDSSPELVLPHSTIFQKADVVIAVAPVSTFFWQRLQIKRFSLSVIE